MKLIVLNQDIEHDVAGLVSGQLVLKLRLQLFRIRVQLLRLTLFLQDFQGNQMIRQVMIKITDILLLHHGELIELIIPLVQFGEPAPAPVLLRYTASRCG